MTKIEIQLHIDHINTMLLNDSNQSYSISPSDGGTGRSATRYDRQQLLKELSMWKRALAKATNPCHAPYCKATF